MTWYLFLLMWVLFLSLNVVGTITLFRMLKKRALPKLHFSGVSILKPLKGADPSLRENLETFFSLDSSPPHELLFSLESTRDPAFAIVQSLMQQFPRVAAQVFVQDQSESVTSEFGLNPKLKNLALSYEKSNYDLVLISDSNVRVPSTLLSNLLEKMDPQTGLVTSIVAGQSGEGLGGALESVYLNTFYARFMALSNHYAKPCVVGKAMLFSKSTAARFGGIRILSQFLAEDFMAGESFQKLGLSIATSTEPAIQVIGNHRLSDFWKRHLRWGRIRKAHAPLAFFVEPLSYSLTTALLGAFAFRHFSAGTFAEAFLGTLGVWFLMDLLQYFRLAQPTLAQSLFFPVAWALRETSALALWLQIASANTIEWRGNRFQLAPGGLIRED